MKDKTRMIVEYRCSCGFRGKSELGYFMRCDNKKCEGKNAFQILRVELDVSGGKSE